MTRRVSPPRIDVEMDAISARLAHVADVALCPDCELPVTALTADIADLLAEVTRLSGVAIAVRRQSANRLAAIRAALRAESDGEPDPLGFLRDELADSTDTPFSGQVGGWWR